MVPCLCAPEAFKYALRRRYREAWRILIMKGAQSFEVGSVSLKLHESTDQVAQINLSFYGFYYAPAESHALKGA